jgi:DNA-binding transcriptional LysR family regulator
LPERDDEPAGNLRVTTLGDLAEELVGEVSAQLVVAHPRLTVELVLTDKPLDLIADRIDVALRIATRPLRDASLSARRVGRIRLQLYAAPSYLARRSMPRRPEQLAEHDWVMLRGVGPTQVFETDVIGKVRVVCGEGNTLRAVLRAGAGIGVLPSYLAADDVERGALVPVLPRVTLRAFDLYLVYPQRQLPRKAIAFRDAIIAGLRRRPLFSLQGSGSEKAR